MHERKIVKPRVDIFKNYTTEGMSEMTLSFYSLNLSILLRNMYLRKLTRRSTMFQR